MDSGGAGQRWAGTGEGEEDGVGRRRGRSDRQLGGALERGGAERAGRSRQQASGIAGSATGPPLPLLPRCASVEGLEGCPSPSSMPHPPAGALPAGGVACVRQIRPIPVPASGFPPVVWQGPQPPPFMITTLERPHPTNLIEAPSKVTSLVPISLLYSYTHYYDG